MNEHEHRVSASQSMRERELELEIARLTAQLEAAQGTADPTDVTARMLAMAATTVDQAMEEARREADELAAEVSADAEARRDEAARIAAEAEARTAELRTEAEGHEQIVARANDEAQTIREAATQEAKSLVATERNKVVDEISALSEVRTALEQERSELESYHEELRRRVHELAESMVSFMTTEPPLSATSAIENLSVPELESESVSPAEVDEELSPAAEVPAPLEDALVDDSDIEPELADNTEPLDDAVEETVEDATPEQSEISAADDGMADTFAGAPVVGEPTDVPLSRSGGLFSRATEDEIAEERSSSSLFGANGARLIEQASPADLAAALGEDDVEDERFATFLAGDEEADPSRDWLLRPDQP